MYISLNKNMMIKRDALSISLEPKVNCFNINKMDDVSFSALNHTSYEFLKLCNGMRSFTDILKMLTRTYSDVSPVQLATDYNNLLSSLVNLKVVHLHEESVQETLHGTIYENTNIVIPKMISFEITTDCQLQCQHCFNSCSPGRDDRIYVDLIKTATLFSRCKELNIQSIFITGGEAMLHPDIDKIVELAYTSFNRITIATNGMVLPSDDFLDKVSNYNVNFQVSLDGNESFHNQFRSNEKSYQNVYMTIQKLLEYDIEVQISYTVFTENIEYIEEEVVKMKDLGVQVFNIGALSIQGSAKDTSYKPLGLIPYLDICHMLDTKYSSDTFQVGSKQSLDSIEYFEQNAKHPNVCGAGYNLLHISADFVVHPCPSMTQLTLGSAIDEDFYDIINIKNVEKFIILPSPTTKRCLGCDIECFGCIANMMEVIRDHDCKVYKQVNLL